MKHPFAKLPLPTLTILILAIGAGAQNASNVLPPTCYLFSSFRGNGDGLHLAWSADGLRWTAFRVGREVLTTLINAPSGQDTAPLNHDERAGKAAGVGERPGEGPKVFRWNNHYWMIVDVLERPRCLPFERCTYLDGTAGQSSRGFRKGRG